MKPENGLYDKEHDILIIEAEIKFRRLKATTTLVSATSSRLIEHVTGTPKIMPVCGWQTIHVVIRYAIVARVMVRAYEHGVLWNHQSVAGDKLADTRGVGHQSESPRVRPAAPAGAGTAVVRCFMRVV